MNVIVMMKIMFMRKMNHFQLQKLKRISKKVMNKKFGIIALLMLLLTILLSSCSGSSTFVASSWPGIAIEEDMLYVSAGNYLRVLDATEGKLDWSYPEKADARTAFYAPAVFQDSSMILSGYDNQLHFTAADGLSADAWTFAAKNRFIDSVVVVDDVIYAANADRVLYAVDLDGNEVWSYKTDSPLWAAPVVENGVIYQVSQRGVLYALKAETGEEIWTLDLGAAVMSSPVISNEGVLYVSTMMNSVVAIESSIGEVIWEGAMSNWAWASPVYVDGMVYVGDSGGSFYAFDALSGELVWDVNLSARIMSEPVILNDHMYIGNEDGEIYAISFDGDKEKLEEVDGQIMTTGVTNGDLIFFTLVGSQDDVLAIGIDQSGSLVWEYVPEN
jgi:outer membrane protein assembly factor BamB